MMRIKRACRPVLTPTATPTATQARHLHLAPPFLLDSYVPRYQMLGSREAAQKRSRAYAHLRKCNLCPRLCGVNRYETTGMCLIGDKAKGHNGSGAVFMSGCNLRCVFCQNHDIAHQRNGMDLTPEELAEWYLKLQTVGGVHNINIVTPEHVAPQVALSILHARELGLHVPIVYNTSSFDSLASLELMDGLVDIYLADFKVWEPSSSRRLLKADDYAATARESVRAMHAQVGDLCFTPDGIAKRGLLVRHLVMPGSEREGAAIMRFLAQDVSKDCFVNIMEQYTPRAHVGKARRGAAARAGGGGEARYQEINRPVNDDEVASVRQAAEAAGLWRFNEPPKHEGFAI
ncbi:pyruvate formate lyase activating enzyme [Cordyceps fumosorosea ARSEF 2679]|uniref:Pyruvate formate lyase activating enzyme n=1 Tax=Cordyceps fumosorosea (strain ARSEF 2679) TaxID=1081104 RepID=A0A167R683_CORFA|nr:pyruvate formate lyase activating enzyme [Cordyceps fumosorosea ARSEF 2679]OAA58308.1 pyruvate formate lyase activating enzyme [Cordyceps fumosorosea ARSEF 2679]